MTPLGHKYSKFKLVLYIPKECGSIADIIKYCKVERLQWDVTMVKADVLHQNSNELRTMLYTTRKEFGISQRAFVEREWNIQFEDGGLLSMSNSLSFEEPVPNNALQNLKTVHTRGINYPGSAWIFERDGKDGNTKMTMIIHSDLKGWIYPGLVNMSLNSHLGNFSRVLLDYVVEQSKKKRM